MKKRILIDATTIVEKKDGLSQYIISLLAQLPKQALEEFDITVLIKTGVKRRELWDVLNARKFKIWQANIAPIGPKRDLDFFIFFLRNKNKFDLFHSTSNQYPVCLKHGIATVHDITFKKYLDSKWWTFNMGSRYLNFVISNSLKKSAAVIAVSNHTKNDLVNTYKCTGEKIYVIYEGWEHLKNNNSLVTEETFPIFTHYLFYVGTTRMHKNIKNLLKGFNIATTDLPQKIKLVISGNETYLDEEEKEIVMQLNKNGQRIVFTGFVSKENLAQLFRNADAFIFPSLSEGFGIPVLEAFYFKKPLLCSNATSLPEIAGNAAIYFDPEKPQKIAEAILHFFKTPALAKELVAKGEERLELFSWEKMAKETVALYKKVLGV
jgi:glycosyltransferase involved in cell wall biosynthesis